MSQAVFCVLGLDEITVYFRILSLTHVYYQKTVCYYDKEQAGATRVASSLCEKVWEPPIGGIITEQQQSEHTLNSIHSFVVFMRD